MGKTTEERLLAKRVILDNGCWEFSGSKTAGGYGYFHVDGRQSTAHRTAYETWVGPTEGLWVLHFCDNRSCFNPEHLFLGTNDDNVADMVSKDRQAKGEQHSQAKLTEEDIPVIFVLYNKLGFYHREIAEMFKVDRKTIAKVLNRETWGWVQV